MAWRPSRKIVIGSALAIRGQAAELIISKHSSTIRMKPPLKLPKSSQWLPMFPYHYAIDRRLRSWRRALSNEDAADGGRAGTMAVGSRSRGVEHIYAYVPLGGKPREITDERDLGWPFTIPGEIDDETLISLVTFLRSSPPIPGVPEGQAPREVVSAPLSGVWRQGDQFIVGLRLREDAEVFGVTVIRKDGQWVVTKWHWSVA